jgi:hypothetical protein
MALESIFEEKFEIALGIAYTTGLEGAWVQGIGTGLMNGMIYFIEGGPLFLPLIQILRRIEADASFFPLLASSPLLHDRRLHGGWNVHLPHRPQYLLARYLLHHLCRSDALLPYVPPFLSFQIPSGS